MPIALITGASQGLGRALAIDLATDGYGLVIDARSAEALKETASALAGLGADVRAIPGDIADPRHRVELARVAIEQGALDLLVNNASSLGPSPLPVLANYDLDSLRSVYETNVIAPLALDQLLLPLLRVSHGTLVAISSDAAVEPYPGWGGYGSSKAALDQIHHVISAEEPYVRVYSFDPGDMRTAMHQSAFPGEDISDRPGPETVVPAFRRLIASSAPSGRYTAAEWML